MPFRNIVIENPANISVRNSQLIIKTSKEHSLAIEDISSILIESRQSSISVAALSELGKKGCAVYVCDEKHMPCAVLEPFHRYSRELPVLYSQLDMTEPQKKRLWQSIVRGKIMNQGRCLELIGHTTDSTKLYAMSENVKSGDSENTEASAAQIYFRTVFGTDFNRSDDNGINAALNYGYSILRGAIARQIAVYGLNPVIGIHHRSTFNSFNLADDLIEPFRPIVDLLVANHFLAEDDLLPEGKRLLLNTLNLDVLLGGRHFSVGYAIECFVQCFANAISLKSTTLEVPVLLNSQQHLYE